MIAVAIVALLFALFGAARVIGAGMAFLMVVTPVALSRRGRHLEALSWVAAGLPMLLQGSIVATWLFARIVLGHRPRVSLDDPTRIGRIVDVPFTATIILNLLFPLSFVGCFLLAFLRSVGGIDGGSDSFARDRKAMLQLVLWVCGFCSPSIFCTFRNFIAADFAVFPGILRSR